MSPARPKDSAILRMMFSPKEKLRKFQLAEAQRTARQVVRRSPRNQA